MHTMISSVVGFFPLKQKPANVFTISDCVVQVLNNLEQVVNVFKQ